MNVEQVREAVDFYLRNPQADEEARRSFIDREVTFTDGSAGARTGRFLLSLLEDGQ